MKTSLRDRLRAETRAVHERLDRAMASGGLDSESGRAALLCDLASGYRAVLGLCYADGSRAREIAARPIVALGEAPPHPVPSSRVIDEDAAAYVFVGAHLGMTVLTTRWERATGAPPPAPLGMPSLAREWSELRRRLDGLDGQGAAAERTVADAIHLFEVFHAGVLRARSDAERAA